MARVILAGCECEKMAARRCLSGRIHSVFDRVVNVLADGSAGVDNLFSVCVRSVPPAPSRVIMDTEISWLRAGLAPEREFRVELGGAAIWRGNYEYELAVPDTIIERLAKIHVPTSEALEGIPYNDTDALIGRGLGLTPSGDDFLVGALYALHFLKCDPLLESLSENVSSALHKTTRLSQHFLKYAIAGKWGQTEQDVLFALLTVGGGDLETSVNNMLSLGSSSGADWLCGMTKGILAALEL